MISKIDIENKAILEYVNSKLSLKTIAQKYNYTGGWLRKVLLRNNIKPRGNSEFKVDVEKEKMAVNDYIKGDYLKDIANRYDVNRRTITEWVKKHGVKPLNFNERIGITKDMKVAAYKMYVDDLMNCQEIAKKLNVSGRSVLDWVWSVKRTKSEISCILSANGKKGGYGIKGTLETRFGLIRYDSTYERDRIIQHCDNENIVELGRCRIYMKYDHRNYNPDFILKYKCGCSFIEEVKPLYKLSDETNIKKFNTAIEYCKNNNMIFAIITEKELYEKK